MSIAKGSATDILVSLILVVYEACMILQRICSTVDEALHFYAMHRTYDGKGITNPSQTRWASWPSHTLSRADDVSAWCPVHL